MPAKSEITMIVDIQVEELVEGKRVQYFLNGDKFFEIDLDEDSDDVLYEMISALTKQQKRCAFNG